MSVWAFCGCGNSRHNHRFYTCGRLHVDSFHDYEVIYISSWNWCCLDYCNCDGGAIHLSILFRKFLCEMPQIFHLRNRNESPGTSM